MQMRDFQQVAGNPRRGRFTTDERQLEIQREYRDSRGQSASHVLVVTLWMQSSRWSKRKNFGQS